MEFRSTAELIEFARGLQGRFARDRPVTVTPIAVTGVFVTGKWWTRLHHYELEYRDGLWSRFAEFYVNTINRHPWDPPLLVYQPLSEYVVAVSLS
jgi:hypothetical protein